MGLGFNTIQFHAERCDGCGDCMLACARAKSGIDDRAQSRISILANDPFARTGIGGYELALCRQCGDPKCVHRMPGRCAGQERGSTA